jgi:hypothetical protein
MSFREKSIIHVRMNAYARSTMHFNTDLKKTLFGGEKYTTIKRSLFGNKRSKQHKICISTIFTQETVFLFPCSAVTRSDLKLKKDYIKTKQKQL